MLRLFILLFFSAPIFSVSSLVYAACPDLSRFYPTADPDWPATLQGLQPLFAECLESSEFFALFGAAQLNTGQLADAMESLERALLLDPDNGAAQIDYASALLQDGQIFSALEINEQVMTREDLPAGLSDQIEARQQSWQALTRQTNWQMDLLAGYDNNLNGAPDQNLITLTLSGDPILLGLNPEFQAVSGPYLSMRAAAQHRRLYPDYQQNFSTEVRGRLSEDSDSDLVQFSGRYSRIQPSQRNSWQFSAGANHLFFGGKPLFTGTDASFRYQLLPFQGCRPYYGVALQHQLWHNQSRLNGAEAKLALGAGCPLPGRDNQLINVELSALGNQELKDNRLGGDRAGWQFAVDWQYRLRNGLFTARYNFTHLLDSDGYSPLLENNARRESSRNTMLLQYQQPLPRIGRSAVLMVNIYHQDQDSNLELFQTTDTTAEIGVSWRF